MKIDWKQRGNVANEDLISFFRDRSRTFFVFFDDVHSGQYIMRNVIDLVQRFRVFRSLRIDHAGEHSYHLSETHVVHVSRHLRGIRRWNLRERRRRRGRRRALLVHGSGRGSSSRWFHSFRFFFTGNGCLLLPRSRIFFRT